MDTTPTPIPDDKPEKSGAGKFIRTFAGDMEILKSGGTPDFVPMGEHGNPAERLVSVSPVAETPPPAPAPAPEPAPDTLMPEHKETLVSPLQTYSADFADRVKDTHASAVTILAAEQDAGPAPEMPAPAPVKQPMVSNKFLVITGLVLLMIGLAGAGIAYVRYQSAIAPVAVAPTITAPIFVDDRQQVSGAGDALLGMVQASVARQLSANQVRLLYIATSAPQSVFALLPTGAPFVVTRNVQPLGSMAGVVNVNGAQSLFFILSVDSYSNTFAGMLQWENTMPRDLVKMYPPYPTDVSQASATTTATTTAKTAPNAPSVTAGFVDATVSNHDVREYLDGQGRVVMVYGYWDQQMLVLARDESAFSEIISRLATSRAQMR